MKNEFEEGDTVKHRGEDVVGTVVDTGYSAPNFMVEWNDGSVDTLENFHTVELVTDVPSYVFVYGTLRNEDLETASLSGFTKDDSWHCPTIAPVVNGSVKGQLKPVEDEEHLAELDRYENCNPDYPDGSLYWRVPITDDVHVYVGNTGTIGTGWNSEYTRDSILNALEDASLET